MNNISPPLPEASLIFVADQISDHLLMLGKFLENEGYQVNLALNSEKTLRLIEEIKPDLILLDLAMTETKGLQFYQSLKNYSKHQEIPLIFLTNNEALETLFKVVEDELIDYITKPFQDQELLTRIRIHLELQATKTQVKELLETQQKLTEKLESLANTDELTHIANRRYFLSLAYQELQRTRRYNRKFAILILDLDDFKEVNEIYGQSLGDQVLQSVAQHISQCLRKTDLLGRFGGEEFIILLRETHLEQSQNVAERIRQSISNLSLTLKDELIKITVSIGISCYQDEDLSLEDILKRANHALQQAKSQGKNCVVTSLS